MLTKSMYSLTQYHKAYALTCKCMFSCMQKVLHLAKGGRRERERKRAREGDMEVYDCQKKLQI